MKGLYFVGVAKQCRRFFPKSQLKRILKHKQRGFYVTYGTTTEVVVGQGEKAEKFYLYATGLKIKKKEKNSIGIYISFTLAALELGGDFAKGI